jgi:hypothetical protein
LISPDSGYRHVDDFDPALHSARSLVTLVEEAPGLDKNTQTLEFPLRCPAGYYVTMRAIVPESGDFAEI